VKQLLSILIILTLCHLGISQEDDTKLSDFFGKKLKTKERALLKSAFAKKERGNPKKKNPLLPDFYAKTLEKITERSQLPSFFNKALEKEKARTQQPDFFSKGIFKAKRSEPGDFFSKSSTSKKRGFQSDHFSSGVSEKEHSEDDITSGRVTKKRVGNRFIGERFRIFSRDPNKKSKPKKSKKKRDPFGKKKRDLDRAQQPRNESDLFPGGVLPKMKDMR